MTTSSTQQTLYPFLHGGGEMAELICRYDWSETGVGSIDTWPVSLRTTLGLVLTSRFPMLLFWGKELITFYNDAFRPSLGDNGKHPSSLGQRGEESWAESWPVIGPMICNIMAGGDAVWFEDQKLPIYREGKMDYAYWTYSFSPVRDDREMISGLLVTCAETTKAVESTQQLVEIKEQQELAIEAAKLGTWRIDLLTNTVTYSKRLQQWLGIDQNVLLVEELPRLPEKDRDRVARALKDAINPEGSRMFDEVYSVVNRKTGESRIIHANGKTVYDAGNKPLYLSGTVQDVTIEQEMQIALENEVRLRTADLATANRNLAEANQQLLRSNEELAQYAYVASHDLQEPLRKIQLFSSMLNSNAEVPQHLHPVIKKIQDSTGRMSLLIKDLLDFSRLLKADSLFRPVDLNEVMASVLNDYEILIAETGAVVEAAPLPVIEGIAFQMQQLFYNLVGNALKFVNPETGPFIRISCEERQKPLNHAEAGCRQTSSWYHISITDNGIGFSQTHAEQIFEVFKRLHSREQYSGTGIGLALCKKIVDNHRGKIYAEAAEGKGARFHIVLPATQENTATAVVE